MQRKKITKQFWLHILAVAIILLCNLWNLNKLYGPQCVPDEIGYLANAAYFAGMDWSGLMQVSPYYSAGYSLLLVPAFLLFKTGIMVYRAGIVINACLLVLCYFLACYVAKAFFPGFDAVRRHLCALAVTLYSFNVFSSQCTQSEVLLVTLQWCLAVLMISISQKPTVWKMILLALCTSYSFSVHMRTVGIVISVCIVVLLLWITRTIAWCHALAFGGITALGIFAVGQFNDWLFSVLYQGSVATNSVEGQLGHISDLLSPQGLAELVVLALGRFFNLGAASFLLFYVGFFAITIEVVLACRAVATKRQKKVEPMCLVKLFFWLNIMAAIGVSSISMEGASGYNRIDAFLYGRYNEFCVGPILLYGVLLLFALRKTKKRDDVAALAVFQILLASVLYLYFRAYNINGSSTYSIGSIYSFPFEDLSSNYRVKYTLMLAVWSILVYAPLRLLCWKWLQMGAILGTGALWVAAGLKSSDELYYSLSTKFSDWNAYAQDVQQVVGDAPVYYYFNYNGENAYYNIFQGKMFFFDVDIQAVCIPTEDGREEERKATEEQILQNPPEFVLYRDGVQGLEDLFSQNVYIPYLTQNKEDLPWTLYVNKDLYSADGGNIQEQTRMIHLNLEEQSVMNGTQVQKKQQDGSWTTVYTKGVDGAEILNKLDDSEVCLVTNAGNELVEEKHQQELLEKQQQVADGLLSEEELEQAEAEPMTLGIAQYTAFGPGLTLQAGSYQASFTIQCLNAEACEDDLLGLCDVSANGGQDVLNSFQLTKESLGDGSAKTIVLDFSSAAGTALSEVEFRVYTNTDVQFRITDISYQYMGPEAKVLLPGTSDFNTAVNLVSLDSSFLPVYVVAESYEQEQLDITDINAVVSGQGHSLSVIPSDQLSSVGDAFVLVPAGRIQVIQSLLPQYTILARLQNYALLVPSSSDVCNTYRDNGGRVLSNGNAISLRYYAGAVNNAVSSSQATIPAGSYRLDYEVQISGASLFDSCGTLTISYGDQKNEIPLTKDLFAYDVCRGSLSENVVLEEDTKLSAQVTTIPEVSGTQLDVWLTPLS